MAFDDQFIHFNDYLITEDRRLIEPHTEWSPEVWDLLDEYYGKCLKGKKSAVKPLERLCKRYPHIPQFKNFLSILYENLGKFSKTHEVTEWILRDHPDYFYGKINMARHYLNKGQYDEVIELLGSELDIRELYPDRDVFHIDEVLAMEDLAFSYYLANGDLVEAEERLEHLEYIDPHSPLTQAARLEMLTQNLTTSIEKEKQYWQHGYYVEDSGYDQSIQTDESPEFEHPEIHQLYEVGDNIDHNLLREILELPRETLISDLEKVVTDSIRRYEYFRSKYDETGQWDDGFSFPTHAVLLLGELEAQESLPVLFELMRQGRELLDFWFSDLLTEFIPEVAYQLGNDQFNELKKFIMEPDNDGYSRYVVSQAVYFTGVHEPNRMDEVKQWYYDILSSLLVKINNKSIIDTDLISLMACDCVELGNQKVLPLIEKFYDLRIMDPHIAGTFDELRENIKDPFFARPTRQVTDIFEKYQRLGHWNQMIDSTPLSPQQNSNDDLPEFNYPDNFFGEVQTFEREHEKIGRNDPCPCGSGKKYKKCCMR